MEKCAKSRQSYADNATPKKKIDYRESDDDDNDETLLSSCSKLSIGCKPSLVNNTGHNLLLLAIKQKRDEQCQAKRRQKLEKQSKLFQQQPAKKKLTTTDIDRLFEEKRQRPPSIKDDLLNLYQNSSSRIRSMLDIKQIDQFIQTTQNRNMNENMK